MRYVLHFGALNLYQLVKSLYCSRYSGWKSDRIKKFDALSKNEIFYQF